MRVVGYAVGLVGLLGGLALWLLEGALQAVTTAGEVGEPVWLALGLVLGGLLVGAVARVSDRPTR